MEKIPKCSPDNETKESCEFSNEPIYSIRELEKLYPDLFHEVMLNLKLNNQETLDFLEEFKFFILKKGTTIVHTTTIEKKEIGDEYFYRESLNWWKKYYPGQRDYKGGWFTYKTSFGGPHFNTELFYKVEQDIPIIYIPNSYKDKFLTSCKENSSSEYYDCKYYKEIKNKIKDLDLKNDYETISKLLTDEYLTYDNLYSLFRWQSSHLIPGVKNWKKKGYNIITHTSGEYADDLGLKMANLGFFGYISCDECEIYLTHKIMESALTHPYKYEFSKYHTLGPVWEIVLKYLIDKEPNQRLRVTEVKSRKNGKYDFIQVPSDIVMNSEYQYLLSK